MGGISHHSPLPVYTIAQGGNGKEFRGIRSRSSICYPNIFMKLCLLFSATYENRITICNSVIHYIQGNVVDNFVMYGTKRNERSSIKCIQCMYSNVSTVGVKSI